MILDLSDLPAGGELATELCIVGGGPAGIAIALALAGSGIDIVLLESGGAGFEADSQALYAGKCAPGCVHPPPERFRQRRLGGSSTLWGGRCAPFDPIDFRARPWVAHSGWPIDEAAIAPFLGEAARLCQLGAPVFEAERAVPGGMRPVFAGFADGDVTTARIERFSPPTDFGRAYRARLAADPALRLVLHANCTEIRLDPGGARVETVRVRSLAGHTVTVRPRALVLAAGGLETARLLLASRRDHPAGLGNGYDQVGRHYMCHLAATMGVFRAAPGGTPPWHGYERDADGVYCRRRFATSAALQQRLGIGNAIARFHHPRIADPAHRTGALSALWFGRFLLPHEYAGRLAEGAVPGGWVGHAGNVLRDLPGSARFAAAMLAGKLGAKRRLPSVVVPPASGVWTLDVHAEQAPDPQSRVRLGDAVDELGMPRLHVSWRSGAFDLRTVQLTVAAMGRALAEGGHGTLHLDPAAAAAAVRSAGAYGGHHLGTARMAESPRRGVVDAACGVHGVANLFIAGGAVFATSSQANPTLTIVALSLRLAAHLRGRLRPAAVSVRREALSLCAAPRA